MEGRCLCGQVTLRVGDHDPRVGACHCRMCQRWSGGLFLCFTADAVQAEGPVVRFQSSSFAERAFCGSCGSHLWFRETGEGDESYELTPGLFDETRSWPLRSELYIDRALASVRLGGDHPRRTRADYESENPHTEGDAP